MLDHITVDYLHSLFSDKVSPRQQAQVLVGLLTLFQAYGKSKEKSTQIILSTITNFLEPFATSGDFHKILSYANAQQLYDIYRLRKFSTHPKMPLTEKFHEGTQKYFKKILFFMPKDDCNDLAESEPQLKRVLKMQASSRADQTDYSQFLIRKFGDQSDQKVPGKGIAATLLAQASSPRNQTSATDKPKRRWILTGLLKFGRRKKTSNDITLGKPTDFKQVSTPPITATNLS